MSTSRQSLYRRLPEIYRIRDAQQHPPGQLKAYLDTLEGPLSGVRDNIEALYHDLFIETCDDWVIPYIADLLGTSHLSGAPWTLRADVARTLRHRRRKGTLGAVESLAHSLSGWAAQALELRRNTAWNQQLNHQRPVRGGQPPLARQHLFDPVRHGTATLRDPAWLSVFGGPFDPYAHVLDLRPPEVGQPRCNFPTLGVFLWRLQDYTVPVSQPGALDYAKSKVAGKAKHVLRVVLHPLAEPMVLFNTHRFHADDDPPEISTADAVPGPMPAARLSSEARTGNPKAYVVVENYPAGGSPKAPGSGAVGLTLHVPAAFSGVKWTFRGANLCVWEDGLSPKLGKDEIVIDPDRGRVLMGFDDPNKAQTMQQGLQASVTHGFSGPTGAQPVSRPDVVNVKPIAYSDQPNGLALQKALEGLPGLQQPLVLEIQDSRTYELDIATISLGRSLWIRAADNQRPVIRLQQPLRFRPAKVIGPAAQDVLQDLEVTLEGLYLSWDRSLDSSNKPRFADNAALIECAALHRLTISGCTLDPGGSRLLDGSRETIRTAIRLDNDHGFKLVAERDAFDQVPELIVKRSILGPLALDDEHSLSLSDSILDAGAGVAAADPALALGVATGDVEKAWGPPTTISGVTLFGRARVERIDGQGGIFVHGLQAHDDQSGCLRFSWFEDRSGRLPQNHGCLFGTEAALSFVSHRFGDPGYAQLRLRSDRRILEQGPKTDAMGAFGYLLDTHKWKNLNIRLREYLPVGIRPVSIPVT